MPVMLANVCWKKIFPRTECIWDTEISEITTRNIYAFCTGSEQYGTGRIFSFARMKYQVTEKNRNVNKKQIHTYLRSTVPVLIFLKNYTCLRK